MRLIVGISGASGVRIGYELLRKLKGSGSCEAHLVMSESAALNFRIEEDMDPAKVIELADYHYDIKDMGARISSGSYKTDGMIVVPCSMKTLSAIANGLDLNLLIRAAGVCLKEGRKVVLVPREMPLSRPNIKNMLEASDSGCVILPPLLTFYNGADTVDKQITHVLGKALMQFGIDLKEFVPWRG
jgi:4-hydroxy-3-polyprenylbenzoate decarboxylase